ncbi:MAG: hypothetical protein LRS46_02655 [Desulfurococcales archaeon]|nr:hypothetical protein [Desulfurococcales archaeon]
MEGQVMPYWLQALLLIVSLAGIIYLTIKQAREVSRVMESQKPPRIITEVKCGDEIIKRDFQEGDYVGGPSAECEGGRVVGIYAVAESQQGEQKGRRKPLLP